MKASISTCLFIAFSVTVPAVPTVLYGQDSADVAYDGLTRIDSRRADMVFALPEADFSGYDSFIILEPLVAFKKNWQRDFNRDAAQRRVTDADMERMKMGLAELFLEVFTDELEEGGYAVGNTPGENVMILRPAVIDLDVTAPDLPTAGRTRSFVTSAGSARIYVEFFDSVSGQILARAVDFQRARESSPSFQWATSVSNRAEARSVLRRWARMLVDQLDDIHGR